MSRKTTLLSVALALAMAPLTHAHDGSRGVPGNPDTTCEIGSDWGDHDYGPPAAGVLIQGRQESNLEDCDGDTTPGDDDGHAEYTRGGAWLLVESGDGVTGGTLLCFGEVGHHVSFGPISVTDLALGATVPFTVEADTFNLVSPEDPCGDFQSDVSTSCVGTCVVTYPPGIDGSYQVYVGFGNPGVQGHVESAGSGSGGQGGSGVGVPYPSAAVVVFDDEGDTDPTVVVAPGWECSSASTGTTTDVECNPDLSSPLFALASAPLKCQNPFARSGGTFMTSGSASASVTCDGVTAGPCSTSWTLSQGGCDVTLQGSYRFPLKCSVSASGTAHTPGAKFYATCGNGA